MADEQAMLVEGKGYKVVLVEGKAYNLLESDGRYVCMNALVEEVDFEFLTSMDGASVAIPLDEERPPAVLCGRSDLKHICECSGRDCGHFINRYEEDEE